MTIICLLDSKCKSFSPVPFSASGFVVLKATLSQWIHPNVELETTPNRIDLLQYRWENESSPPQAHILHAEYAISSVICGTKRIFPIMTGSSEPEMAIK